MDVYPLFPLELVVFPLEKLNLHIFEPRYRQLINDCKKDKFLFGIPTYRKDEPLKYGSLVRLLEIKKKYADGRMDVKTEGVCVFEMNEYLQIYPDRLYPGGHLTKKKLILQNEILLNVEIKDRLLELYDFMNINAIPKALEKNNFYTFEIAHKVGFNADQEYAFLQIPTELERQEYMLAHLNNLIPIARNMEEMRKKVQQNGHFKDILPPKI